VGGPCSPNALAHSEPHRKVVNSYYEVVPDANIMSVPYQCIVARSSEATEDWAIFAASGSKLVVQSSSGATTTWPQQDSRIEVSDGVMNMMWQCCGIRLGSRSVAHR
jgi:hypothetical protein